jgi:hypothetical protein
MEISKRLGIAYKSALNLKRRFQLFCAQQSNKIQQLITDELNQRYNGFNFPVKRDTDLAPYLKPVEHKLSSNKRPVNLTSHHITSNNPVNTGSNQDGLPYTTEEIKPVNIDTMVLFSASQRANKGRSRYRSGCGVSASAYLSDALGGKQIGSIMQTITWKKGPVILRSVPTQRAEHLRPILDSYIPHRVPVFSDEGYKWYVNPNHRMVNHSAKSKDKRYRWARNRYSKNSCHVQCAEGIQSSWKTAMRNYRYFKPAYSQLYAEEWCFLKNLKYFGVDRVIEGGLGVSPDKRAVGSEYMEFEPSTLAHQILL